MTLLIADVGGTNTRVATVPAGASDPVNQQRYTNAEFTSLYHLLQDDVTTQSRGAITGCAIAMAGTVRGGQGRLTNRNWDISITDLRRVLGCDTALLMNDLTALGHALADLPASSTQLISAPTADTFQNNQSLVVGIGTGFNLCPVKVGPDGNPDCLEVEMGHAALPSPLRDALQDAIGRTATDFPTLEDLFSGDGLARFHTACVPGADLTAKEIVLAHQSGDAPATATLNTYTRLLGLLCAELAFQYMPMNGLYFAGSVARGVITPEFHTHLAGAGAGGGKVGNLLHSIPKWTLLDDAAALRGCMAAMRAQTKVR